MGTIEFHTHFVIVSIHARTIPNDRTTFVSTATKSSISSSSNAQIYYF
jgi:hypothetical protein